MTDPIIICSQCGKQITEGKVYTHGDLKDDLLRPIFCSTACAELHDPTAFTFNKLSSIQGRLAK